MGLGKNCFFGLCLVFLLLGVHAASNEAVNNRAQIQAELDSLLKNSTVAEVVKAGGIGGANVSVSEIDSWTPPDELIKKLPFYVAGYDYENRPVVVSEFGRWDLRSLLEGSEESKKLAYMYGRKCWRSVEKLGIPATEEQEEGVTLILDGADFSDFQLLSREVIRFNLWSARQADMIEAMLANIIIINANFNVQTSMNLIRPVGGRWLGKSETYGTNQAKVKAALGKHVPRDQLPPWYGGTNKNYKPIRPF